MHRLICQNDQIIDTADARISPTLTGVLYGWGVFTTLRICDGKVFALDRHWKRLTLHAEKAKISGAPDLKQVRRLLDKLIAANRVENGRARMTLLKAGAGSWRVDTGGESEFLLFTTDDLPRPAAECALTLSPYRILSTALLAGVKQTAMLENLFALEEARSRGFNEAGVLNERGQIVSTAAANIFWIQGADVFTPSLATGCVGGVTRHFIRQLTTRWKLHLVEGSFPIQRLLDARELFLTSTARGITIVSSFDSKTYALKQARIAKLLSREFQKLVRDATIS